MRRVIWIVLLVVVVGGAGIYARVRFSGPAATPITVEKTATRDLEEVVSASGTIQPEHSVNISADTMGRVVDLAVDEGYVVKKGQFLLQVDPHNLETAVQNQTASLEGARSSLEETRKSIESSKASLTQSEQAFARQENLYKRGLATRQDYENTQSDLQMKKASAALAEQQLSTQETRIKQQAAQLESAQYDLTKVRIVSPIDGVITKRNIEQGETVVVGTMNNAGTVLLTVADMSTIQAEVNVDETDIPNVKIGQHARISIDAVPDQTFDGVVTEVGNSPVDSSGNATTTSSASTRATNFKVVVKVTGQIPAVRPGFSCTASITTAARKSVLSVPIQAMTVRELVIDRAGAIVPEPPTHGSSTATSGPVELKPGESRKEFDGVFVLHDGHAAFAPLKTGIAGDKYFEVLSGVQAGDQIITGPFASVRGLKDGDAVAMATGAAAK